MAVVPARGGSKGIKLKNLREVGGVPLVALAARVARALPWIDLAVVSTDHPDIARVAAAEGLDASFPRPERLAGDRIADWDVLVDSLQQAEQRDGVQYDIVIMLQPTSPMRRAEHVEAVVRQLVSQDFDAVWSVSETDSKAHPLKQLVVGAGGDMSYYDPAGANIIARQQLQPVYHRNGIAYAITRSCLLEQQTIKGRRTGAYVIDDLLVNIDTEFDLDLANFVVARAAADLKDKD